LCIEIPSSLVILNGFSCIIIFSFLLNNFLI
jgi:hypothetical protein